MYVTTPRARHRQALSVLLVAGGLVIGTGSASSQMPSFDAASVKPYSGGGSRTGGGPPLRFTPGMVANNVGGVTAKTIILTAYRLQGYQLSGGPSWVDSDRFELEARAVVPSAADESQLRLMLQTLLAQRFRLVAHSERQEVSVYALTVGKSGPKFRELKNGEDPPPIPSAPMRIEGSIQSLVNSLNAGAGRIFNGLDRPVVDRTGLQGTYDFVLKQDFQNDDIKTIMEEDLGLKFELQKMPMDILVIDRLEKPDPN